MVESFEYADRWITNPNKPQLSELYLNTDAGSMVASVEAHHIFTIGEIPATVRMTLSILPKMVVDTTTAKISLMHLMRQFTAAPLLPTDQPPIISTTVGRLINGVLMNNFNFYICPSIQSSL